MEKGNFISTIKIQINPQPYFIIATDTYSEDYSQKYKAYLLTLGYTTEDNITFVNETDKLRIDVVDDDGSYEFIHIYVLN